MFNRGSGCCLYHMVEDGLSGGPLPPSAPWKNVDLQAGNISRLHPFISPDQELINGKIHFVGRSGVGKESFIGPVITNEGLVKCPGSGKPNEIPLKTYDVLVVDPGMVHWVPVWNGNLHSDEDPFATGIPKVSIGRRKDHGIGMVRLNNGTWEYYSYERAQPYYEEFEVLCIKRK